MQRILGRLNAASDHRRAGPVLLLAVAALYTMAYFEHPLFPGHDAGATTRGWWTWTDQQRYLQEAGAIAGLRLDAATYFYPVGYPALGALCVRAMPVNPFFLPDLLLVLGAAAVWWRLARRWLGGIEAVAVAALFLATHRWLVASTMVVPWNTLATQAALLAGIGVVHAMTEARAVRWLALLAAAAYLVRPVDAVAFAPLLGWATLRLPTWRGRLVAGLGGAAVIAAAVAAVAGLNGAIFGQWRTPYEVVSTQTVGFFSYPISYKLFWLLVDGRPLFGETAPALLWRYPWLFLVGPAAIFWVQREGRTAVAALLAVGVNWLLYLNYNDFLPSDIYRYTLIHYLAWSFPLLFLPVAAACRHGWRSGGVRAGFAVTAGALIFCAGIRLDERGLKTEPVAGGGWRLPATRPLLIKFPGVPQEAVATLRVDGRSLVEYSEYVGPEVSADLQVLLGMRTKGGVLSRADGAKPGAVPAIGEFGWAWRMSPARLTRFFQ